MAQNTSPAMPSNGSELAVFGSVFFVAAGAVPDVGAGAVGVDPIVGATAATAAFSSGVKVASTCRAVMTCGGFSVTIIAVSLSPV